VTVTLGDTAGGTEDVVSVVPNTLFCTFCATVEAVFAALVAISDAVLTADSAVDETALYA